MLHLTRTRPATERTEPPLDPDQLAAVRARGPVRRVLGGPGTGKTTVAAALVTDRMRGGRIDPARCLLLAPSRVAAGRLREQVTAGLGHTTTEPLARTLPAFAFGLLRAEAALTGAPPPVLLSGPEQDVILAELLAGHERGVGRAPAWPEEVLAALGTRGFRAELRDLLMRAVEHALDPADLAALGAEHEEPAWGPASRVLAEYDEVTALSRPGGYDPAWILGAAADLLDDAAATERVRSRLGLVVVDDAQELTRAGARLLDAACGPDTELVLVGDPDAATQGFRGAEPGLLAGDWHRVREVPTQVLGTGWRQPELPARATARVTAHIGAVGTLEQRRSAPATAGTSSATPGRVEVAVVESAAQEAHLVTARLRRVHLLEGVPWSQTAVVVRGSARTAALRRDLAAAGVPVTVPGAQVSLRAEAAVRPLLILFGLALPTSPQPAAPGWATGGTPSTKKHEHVCDIVHEHACDIVEDAVRAVDVETLVEVLRSPIGGADPLLVRRLRRALRRREQAAGGSRSSDELLVAAVTGEEALLDVGPVGAPLARVAAALAAGRAAARDRPEAGRAEGRLEGRQGPVTCESVLWAIWSATGLAGPWQRLALRGGAAGARADRDLDSVLALFEAAARYVERLPHRGPQGFLEHVLGQDVAADTLAPGAPRQDCVTLTTPQGAAGRQWQVVVVAGVQEGVWPDLRLRGSLLGSERLVDALAGRSSSLPAAQAAVRQDETRLFRTAVSRASHSLLVTAVSSAQENPSPFLDLIDPPREADREHRRPTPVPPAMTLGGVVAELRRRAVGDPDERIRRGCARRLARLAAAGVSGSHPDSWWAVREVSEQRALRAGDAPVTVSPSRVESFLQCELRWLLVSAGGESTHPHVGSAVGNLVHDIAAEVDNADESALLDALERRWPDLRLPQGWVSRRQRDQAAAMLTRLARYHREAQAQGWRLVAREVGAETVVGRAAVRGRVDRLEQDPQGRLRVVDLKTGARKPGRAELDRLPQLGAYQVAVEHGAFPEFGSHSAGAALLQLGKAANRSTTLQTQGPLGADEDPKWAATVLDDTAARMAGHRFRARAGDWCRTCPARISCPLHTEGESL